MNDQQKEYILEFSNRAIEHLGIKLYQNKPTNVVAEFVSNSWDADAKRVSISLIDRDNRGITIIDNGRGMTKEQLISEFLVIGRNRRSTPSEKTKGERKPMGRKGIGKLAGFGIAKTVDILSIPNPNLRDDFGNNESKLYWLRFKLEEVLATPESGGTSGYSPEVVANGLPISQINQLFIERGVESIFKEFNENAIAGEGGFCVHLHDLTTKKSINPETLLSSLAHRFTVTMLHPDFVVRVNDADVDPKTALPKFQDFSIGSIEKPLTDTILIDGVEQKIKYWVGFVSLNESEWPIENAGVGVYTHHKIAQDRPFFFGVKGKEIFSRYMYGVVEADWLDELPEDIVSTDRRSINWDDDATIALHNWGANKVHKWIDEFRNWKKEFPKTKIKALLRSIPAANGFTGPEEDALTELLSEVFLTLGNNEIAKQNVAEGFASAWTHEPTRKLTQSLWKEVIKNDGQSADIMSGLVERLRESMVPEAMSLAVTVAQRVAAITSLMRLTQNNCTETKLQKLIEQFPWILGPQWEFLTANQTIRTLVTDRFPSELPKSTNIDVTEAQNKRPDFVFLSDGEVTKQIVVFELKGPECEKTLRIDEYRQLIKYLDTIYDAYPSVAIKGVLIGHDKGGFAESDSRIKIERWDEVLQQARSSHVSFLLSLLAVSSPSNQDLRLSQIALYGGDTTVELLRKLSKITNLGTDVVEYLTDSPT
jgi:Histidine kinase-, DNA gyrase B-, and HSP90-like ATPase